MVALCPIAPLHQRRLQSSVTWRLAVVPAQLSMSVLTRWRPHRQTRPFCISSATPGRRFRATRPYSIPEGFLPDMLMLIMRRTEQLSISGMHRLHG